MKKTQLVFSKWIIGGTVTALFLSSAVAQGKTQPAKKATAGRSISKTQSVRKPASIKPQPILKFVKGENPVENTVEKMDARENHLQTCLIELKVPTYYEANVNRATNMVEIWEAADPKKTHYTFAVNPKSKAGNLDVEKFFKAAIYNRILKEVRAKEELGAQMKKPNFFQRLLGIQTAYDVVAKKFDYNGEQCAKFLASVGREKMGQDFKFFIQGHQSNMAALKGKAPQPMNLSYYVKAGSRPGLASLGR